MLKNRTILAAAAVALAMAAPASAQVVLTVSSEQTTTWVRNFNPFNQTSARATTKDFIYEPLAIFNRLAGNKWEYRLAESFELADDLKSISFTLRDGMKWSDGEPITVDDVVFTYAYLKKFPALDFNSVSALMESVEKVDEHTVRFNLIKPNSLIATTIVGMPIVPEHIWKDIADPATFANETPVGSGPLTEISRFTPQVYEQCRNPNYWDAASLKVDCIRLPQLADNPQVLAALADGTLDWSTSFIPDIDNTFVAKDPEHNKYWFLPSSLVAFTLNLESPDAGNKKAFNDVNFRRAFSMLIDRQTIIDVAGYGYPVINEDPAMLGEFYKAFGNPEVAVQFGQYGKFDLDAGMALLEKSGYVDKDGDGFRDNPDGTPISIDIEIPNGWTDWIDATQIAIETLKQAGLNVKMSTPEESVWASDLIDAKYSASLNAIGSAANPYFPYIRSFNPADFGKSRAAAQRWTDPEVIAMLDKYTQVKDPAEQKSIMDAIQLKVAAAMPVIPVYNSPSFYQYSTKRFTGWANADNQITS
ncbi:MAG: ABC transporter substrate-binding protein, partial [Devosia sp.]